MRPAVLPRGAPGPSRPTPSSLGCPRHAALWPPARRARCSETNRQSPSAQVRRAVRRAPRSIWLPRPAPPLAVTQPGGRPTLAIGHIQCASPRCFGPQPSRKRRRRLARHHIAGSLEFSPGSLANPATDDAQLHFVPVAFDRHAVQMPIAVAHHHSVGLDDQRARRRLILRRGWLVLCLDMRPQRALLAFQFGPHAFGLEAQCLRSNLHPAELSQQPRRLAEGRDRAQQRFPGRQPSAGLLMRRQPKRPITRTPALATCAAVVPFSMLSSSRGPTCRTASSTPCSCTSGLASRCARMCSPSARPSASKTGTISSGRSA